MLSLLDLLHFIQPYLTEVTNRFREEKQNDSLREQNSYIQMMQGAVPALSEMDENLVSGVLFPFNLTEHLNEATGTF